MLFAEVNGRRVKASRDLQRNEPYTCPYLYCPNRRLILKKGLRKRPHFAHRVQTKCDSYAEPETTAHIAMKEFMQRLLSIPDKYMEYGKLREVRPDLLWLNHYALEVQHSLIPPEEVERRNAIYFRHGILPIWIFHAREFENHHHFERGHYRQSHELGDTSKVCLGLHPCDCFKEFPVFCNKLSCEPDKQPAYTYPKVPDLCPICRNPISLGYNYCPVCHTFYDFAQDPEPSHETPSITEGFHKLRGAGQYVLQIQGVLWYLHFDLDFTPDEPLFYLIDFLKIRNRKTIYLDKDEIKTNPSSYHINSKDTFIQWITAYHTRCTKVGLIGPRKTKTVQSTLG